MMLAIKMALSLALALPIAIVAGAIYVAVAIAVVEYFSLNYGQKPKGMMALNFALILAVATYFLSFGFFVSRIP